MGRSTCLVLGAAVLTPVVMTTPAPLPPTPQHERHPRLMQTHQALVSVTTPARRLFTALALGAASALAAPGAASADVVQAFENPSPVALGAPTTATPSTIQVPAGLRPIVDVEVVIPDVDHGDSGDIQLLLAGPTGIGVMLMSDVGAAAPIENVVLRFDDESPPFPDSGPTAGGAFAPANRGTGVDVVPAGAPATSTAALSAFDGTDPTGTWSLFAVDDDDGVTGDLARGWQLFLTVRDDLCGGVNEDGFTDVPEANVHEAAIDCIVAFGVASGTSATTFNPSGNVSRAQMATFVAQAMAAADFIPAASPTDAFDDDDGATHELRINQIAAAGVIGGNGESGTSYFPSGDMRRDHMASYMFEAFDAILGEPLAAGPNAFTDDEGNPHEVAINALAGAGVITGTGGGLFNPTGTVSRAQMGSFLARFLQLLADEGAID